MKNTKRHEKEKRILPQRTQRKKDKNENNHKWNSNTGNPIEDIYRLDATLKNKPLPLPEYILLTPSILEATFDKDFNLWKGLGIRIPKKELMKMVYKTFGIRYWLFFWKRRYYIAKTTFECLEKMEKK